MLHYGAGHAAMKPLDKIQKVLDDIVRKKDVFLKLVSRAVPPLRASKPNKMKLMLMVLMLGLGLGVGAPLAYGRFVARRLRCRDDVERDFGIAVLAQLEAVPALARAT